MSGLGITLGGTRLVDLLPWRSMDCAPTDRPILLFSEETGEFSVASHMTSFVNGDQDWIMARGFNEAGEQVAFRFRDPALWTDLPSKPVAREA